MNKAYSTSIKERTNYIIRVPYYIKIFCSASIHKNLHVIGYKKIQQKKYAIMIELKDCNRIWLLPNEINIKISQ